MEGAIVVIVLAMTAWLGSTIRDGQISRDCKNFGKVEINSKWYDCKPVLP